MARLETGDLAPDFTLPSDTGEQVSLRDFRGRKVILFFYPAAMTPGCTTQACDFRDSLERLRAAGYEVVGISKDAPERLARFREKEGLTYPLLGDPELAVLQAYGAYGEKKSYGKTITGVIRSTVVVDEQGRVELARYNVKAKGHVAMLSGLLGLGE
ncbi:thioredoxin-dependent thiol peroxidase [Arsenicicoccus dermatophilus]|uniref:thioredoxin-dependent thiol peroxidase n=1 Tax=Arsenicicoccus dermatophilus TaxID=1076331 RepID=UPI001F4D1E42|nr:thioredoxin-dependent thiol peroxidase [Arsenicicoccus dermatophilus]